MWMIVFALALALVIPLQPAAAADAEDPYLWLEEVQGERAIAWAKEQNARTLPELESHPSFAPIKKRVLEILDSKDRIAYPEFLGDYVYNFWQDDEHPRGIWRRTTLDSYRSPDPTWETVFDVDALAESEDVSWAWKGADCLPPECVHCMVGLSRGGADATEKREFDTAKKTFVDGGFQLEEAKSFVSWRDENAMWVGTDLGEGSLTSSGYPRIAKLWTRGTPLSEAQTIYEVGVDDVGGYGYSEHTPEGRRDFVLRVPAFFRQELFLAGGDGLMKLDLQEDADVQGVFKGRLLVLLRSDWALGNETYRQGSLIALRLDPFLKGDTQVEVLFEPSARVFLRHVSVTRDQVILSIMDNVRGKLEALTPGESGWTHAAVPLPGLGAVRVQTSNVWQPEFAFTYEDMLTPVSMYVGSGTDVQKAETAPAFFSPEGMEVTQHEAKSKDGTMIPYFMVTPKGFVANGQAPTLLHGYGGFEVPTLPRYRSLTGASWMARGGVYVIANIRGGGEFGPSWHQAALKEKRIKSFEDFIAVAEDLIARKVTSPKHLGIVGGSQGGLLVAGAFTLRPDLFGAVVSQVPLADMRRYHKLLAGASWMAEYGNPDVPEEWAYIKTWSPYHLLRKDVKYPTPYFWTNTRDDRVHPAHARKMVARMMEQGHSVYYFENLEGGHALGVVNEERAHVLALEYAYLWKMLQ